MMRRIVMLIAVLAVCLSAAAQFRWGPVAGVNISNYRFKQKLLQCNQTIGPEVGIIGELMFPGIGLGVDLGLNYSMRGSKLHFDEFPVFAPTTAKKSILHSLQIPINLRFKYTRLNGVEDKIAPFVFAGPVFNITLGHNKLEPLEYSGGAVALQCGLGAELFKHWQVWGSYQWGMTYEVRTRKLDNYSARCSGWRIKVAYLF